MNPPSVSTLEIRRPADGRALRSIPIVDGDRVRSAALELREAQVAWHDIGPAARAAVR